MKLELTHPTEILAYQMGMKDIQIVNLAVQLDKAKEHITFLTAEVERVKEHYRKATPPVDTDNLGGELRREPHTDEGNYSGPHYAKGN